MGLDIDVGLICIEIFELMGTDEFIKEKYVERKRGPSIERALGVRYE